MMQAICRPFMKARRVNANDVAFPSRVATLTNPNSANPPSATSREVMEISTKGGGGSSPYKALIVPFGLGADNDSFLMRVIGWKRVEVGVVNLYVPMILASFTCTMCAMTGVAGAPVLNTERFCDTIAILSEPTYTADVTRRGTVKVYSPGGDQIGWVELEIEGAENIEFTFADNVTSPTKNALISFLF